MNVAVKQVIRGLTWEWLNADGLILTAESEELKYNV
jgi:hypothetical protein